MLYICSRARDSSTLNNPSVHSNQMDRNHCPLLALPPELRLCIYDYVYEPPSSHPCTFTILKTGRIQTFSLPTFKWEGAASLLRTCKQINQEATPILYGWAKFKLSIFGQAFEYLPPMVNYGHTRDCPTFRNIRHLTITLHIDFNGQVEESMLQHLATTLHLLDAERALASCSVRLVLHSSLNSWDAKVALVVIRWILQLERKRKLNVVERQVYSYMWTEAMRVSRRSSFEYDSCKKLRQYLKRTHAGEQRQVGNTARPYDVRQRKMG